MGLIFLILSALLGFLATFAVWDLIRVVNKRRTLRAAAIEAVGRARNWNMFIR